MWITGVSFPVVSISYHLSTRSQKLELMVERWSKNADPSARHWEGGVTFEVWGCKKHGSVAARDAKVLYRESKLDSRTLNFVANGPSKLEGTLALTGDFSCIKVTDVWIASEVKIEQSRQAWSSTLRSCCDVRMQMWCIRALCKQQHFKLVEQVLFSDDMHYLVREIAAEELFNANHVDSLFQFCAKDDHDEHAKPAYYKALSLIGQLRTTEGLDFVSKRIFRMADPLAQAYLAGQRVGHVQARNLCDALVKREIAHPHGFLTMQCLRILEDADASRRCLGIEVDDEVNLAWKNTEVPSNTRLAWNTWSRFFDDKWRVEGSAPLIVDEEGYYFPRVVRKRALQVLKKEEDKLESEEYNLPHMQYLAKCTTGEDFQRWLWETEYRCEEPRDPMVIPDDPHVFYSYPLVRPALSRLRAKSRLAPLCDIGGSNEKKRPGPALLAGEDEDEPWETAASAAINQILTFADSYHFRNTLNDFPSNLMNMYKIKIRTPMDLNTVAQNLRQQKYADPDAFMADVELIWTNAQLFNGPESKVGQHANCCRAHFAILYKAPKVKVSKMTLA